MGILARRGAGARRWVLEGRFAAGHLESGISGFDPLAEVRSRSIMSWMGNSWLNRGTALGTLAATTVIFAFSFTKTPDRPQSALTANLSGGWDAANREFDRRIKARFPLGSTVDQLIANLSEQGFVAEWPDARFNEYAAYSDVGNWVCNIGAHVYWTVGENGRIRSIRGMYREEGCL